MAKKSIWDQVDVYQDKYGEKPPAVKGKKPPRKKGMFTRFAESIVGDRDKQIIDAVSRAKKRPLRRKKK